MPLPLIAAGVGLVGAVGKMFARGAANKKMRALEKSNPMYAKNPLADQRMGLANTLLNARSPGAAAMEQNIFTNQANSISNAQRGATDASQFLAVGGGIQGATNNAFNQLGQQETADYQRRYGNQVSALEANINEDDKVFNDQTRRWENKAQLQGAMSANNAANFGDLSNMGFSMASFAANGGFGGGGGNGGNGGGGGLPNSTFRWGQDSLAGSRYNPQTGRMERP